MVSRREFGFAALAAASDITSLSSCSSSGTSDSYDAAVLNTWHHSKGESGDKSTLLRELVRYATLAPSS